MEYDIVPGVEIHQNSIVAIVAQCDQTRIEMCVKDTCLS